MGVEVVFYGGSYSLGVAGLLFSGGFANGGFLLLLVAYNATTYSTCLCLLNISIKVGISIGILIILLSQLNPQEVINEISRSLTPKNSSIE